MSVHSVHGRPRAALALLLSVVVMSLAVVPTQAILQPGVDGTSSGLLVEDGLSGGEGHLVVSEVVTGGASASDEFIELYNPTPSALPLEGLEVVYVSASGTTVSRRAAWEAGASGLPSGGHVLVANAGGVYAGIADATYTTGMAATGGSVALRIIGATTSIDAAGWGTATGSWLEGQPAAAPPAGSSMERLPGGSFGSTQDSGDNATDFVVRSVPDPQNTASAPVPPGDPEASSSPTPSSTATPTATGTAEATPTAVPTAEVTPTSVPTLEPTPTPSATATAGPTATPEPTPSQTPESTPSPSPTETPASITSIAAARSLPDDSVVTIEGVALTAWDFADGGGFVADASGGIAVLVTDGSYARGALLRLTGVVDDRYHQRTLRVSAAQIMVLGTGSEPAPVSRTTAGIDESVEGALVHLEGTVVSGPDALSSGPAFNLDDGSGPVRVLVATATGIGTEAWTAGSRVELIGVVGQRDSTSGGIAGYRVQPRDPNDILAVIDPPEPTPSPSATPSPSNSASPTASFSPSPTPSASATAPNEAVVSIAAARAEPANAHVRIRGVVTSPTGHIEPGSAVVQDGTAAILLRVGNDLALARGELIEVGGTRSTKAGMLTLRVTEPVIRRGSQAEPVATRLATGAAGEPHEARLVTARGALTESPRKSSAGSISFAIDDGSGELRVFVTARSALSVDGMARGAWIEVTGVLGQETTGSQPDRGYRVLPRDAGDLRIIAPAAPAAGGTGTGGDGTTTGAGGDGDTTTPIFDAGTQDLSAVGERAGEPVGATLVAGSWPELGIAGLLWDGERLRGIAVDPDALAAVDRIVTGGGLPATIGVVASGSDRQLIGLDIELLAFGPGGALVPANGTPAAPESQLLDGEPRWVTITGRLAKRDARIQLDAGDEQIAIDVRCAAGHAPPAGAATVTGIGIGGDGARIVVPCGGIRRAPQLAAATGKGRAALIAHGGPPTTTASPPEPAAESGRSPILLVVAVSLIALATAIAFAWQQGALSRWAAAIGLRTEVAAPPGDGAETEDPSDDAADAQDRTRELPAVPRLSVVSLRERPE